MRIHLFLMFLAASAVLMTQTGCKSKKINGDGTDGGLNSLTPMGEDGGLIQPGRSFDETHTRVPGLSLTPVYFGYDSYQLPNAEMAKIDAAVRCLQDNGSYVCIVEGHCDERGSNEYNISLGEQRALTVRTYMTSAGIAESRIQTKSFGEEKPAVIGSGDAVWSKNRRGEFAIYH